MLRVSGASGSLWAVKPNVEEDGKVFSLAGTSGANDSKDSQTLLAFAAFTCSGRTIAVGCCSGSGTGTVPVYTLHLAENRFSRVGRSTAGCSALCTHPTDDQRLVVGTSAGTLHALQWGSTHAQTDLLRIHKTAVRFVEYTRDAAYLVSASEDMVVVWDAKVCKHCSH